jgi:amino acid permease
MESNTQNHLAPFKRNSAIALVTYLIAVAATLYFTFNEHEQIVASSVKIACYAIYLTFMSLSLVNLKNHFEATRKDDYSMDVLVYTIVGIPVYIFAYFFIQPKLK